MVICIADTFFEQVPFIIQSIDDDGNIRKYSCLCKRYTNVDVLSWNPDPNLVHTITPHNDTVNGFMYTSIEVRYPKNDNRFNEPRCVLTTPYSIIEIKP
nr:putative alpha chemokine ligand [Elephant endotheliotropic herpesvirus 6]